MKYAIVGITALALVVWVVWMVQANEVVDIGIPELPAIGENSDDWPVVQVGDVLGGFKANPHRAEQDYQNVRIVGPVRTVGADTRKPHIILHNDDLFGWNGLLVFVDSEFAAIAEPGRRVTVHCRQAVARYTPEDWGETLTRGPWCEDVADVESGDKEAEAELMRLTSGDRKSDYTPPVMPSPTPTIRVIDLTSPADPAAP